MAGLAGADTGGKVRADLARHREHLWALCYRMTGSSADADDLVQATFQRALETPPADIERDLRPWLVRVAVNLSRDALRARKRRGYDGTWLPSPIETRAPVANETARAADSEARYGELQSVSFAFLIALEALTPSQRAVLLLRDVFDYSVSETARALALGEPNVKTTLHRARKAMLDYEAKARPATVQEAERTRAVLQAFMVHMASRNVAALEALLAQDVRARNDGGGEFFAARKPVLGIDKVILFHFKTAGDSGVRVALRTLNGMPAIVAERVHAAPRIPKRMVVRIELDANGCIREIDAVVATRKLHAIRFDDLPRHPGVELVPALRAALMHPPVRAWGPSAVKRVGRAGLKKLRAWSAARVRRRKPRRA